MQSQHNSVVEAREQYSATVEEQGTKDFFLENHVTRLEPKTTIESKVKRRS